MVLETLFPGIAFASWTGLLLLSFFQLYGYLKTHSYRSLYLFLFCVCASVYSFMNFVVFSRAFTPEFTHFLVMFCQIAIYLHYYFYMKSLSFFVAIPNRLVKAYQFLMLTLSTLAFLPIISFYFFDYPLFFDTSTKLKFGNFFLDSYTNRIGAPMQGPLIILSIAAAFNIGASFFILNRLRKTSRDGWLIAGLIITIVSSLFEHLPLPFTLSPFVPTLFLANIFEALRMSFLHLKEYWTENYQEDKPVVTPAYQNSNLSEERIKELVDQLNTVLRNDEVYLDANLRVEKLARRIGIPSYQLSQVINIGMQTTFYDLINMYRIDRVKEILLDEKQDSRTIIDIAYSCGFNSKSTFNSLFKKNTDLTPSEFRKKARSVVTKQP